jgi:Prolipoprotein diacylglyceryltransferase
VKNERLWGGPAPITLVQLDDFILWVTIGIIVGGRTGYVLFYNLRLLRAAPGGNLRTCGRAACRFTAASSAASPR